MKVCCRLLLGLSVKFLLVLSIVLVGLRWCRVLSFLKLGRLGRLLGLFLRVF